MNFYDRIKTSSATASGTGNIAWTAASPQSQLPPASINETVIYTVLDSAGSAWETGRAVLSESGGTYTLTRGGAQTVTGSSNSDAAVTLTNSGYHTVFLAPDAQFFDFSDMDGAQIGAFRNVVSTSVSGSLTSAAHSGGVLVTSGNVTVPNAAGDVGFSCVLVAGGAHTVTFNSTVSAAMAAGDLMTILVESTTVIHAVLTAAADKVVFS